MVLYLAVASLNLLMLSSSRTRHRKRVAGRTRIITLVDGEAQDSLNH